MRPVHELQIGDDAPDFCLPVTRAADGHQVKTTVCLHEYRGRQPVILTFYQAAFTPL